MKIVVAGGSGFIGSALVGHLVERGDEVVILTRDPRQVRVGRGVEWSPPTIGSWTREVKSADAVVNLAGESIGEGRWTDERKRRLVRSRIDSTNALVAALKEHPAEERAFISASAVGFYGSRGDEALDENASQGRGFLADLTREWESVAGEATTVARVVIARFGVVLGSDGGALAKMLLPFRLGLGGPIGNGQQWMSWIHRDDVVRFIEWALADGGARGIYNVTSEEPVRNREFTRALGKALRRPAVLPVPGFALRALFGQMADEVLVAGQRVVPRRATAEGFTFSYPSIDAALQEIFSKRRDE
ncbi:MAG TPA: TIGR01777 family oxidoreductase [Thermoanaerobaculia bacterium]|nr:TIGR01777 family oxidoreductase [Thermoanaerobaculia bacterium]